MKPDQVWFNGKEFFKAGVCISSYPIELDKIGAGSTSSVDGANESDPYREGNKS